MSAAPPERGFRHLTLGAGVRASARRAPDKTAVACEGRALTYAAFVERMGKVGAFASAQGLGAGARAMVLAPNCLEYLEVCLGLSDMGVAVATPNPRLSPREVADILEDCSPSLLFVHPSAEAVAREAVERLGAGAPQIVVFGPAYEARLAEAHGGATFPAFPEWTPFSIPYTSGTTGKPKGVLLPHRSRVLAAFGMAAEFGCYGPDDAFLALAPMAHGAGMAFALASVFFGGTCTVLPTFDPEETLRAMTSGAHTGIFLVPTHFHKIFGLPQATLDALRGKGALKAIMSNAAPLPQPTKRRIVDYFGEGLLHEMYGSTEASIVTNLRPAFQLRKDTCVGTPFACTEVELRGDDGGPVPDGQPGELFSRSPYLFNGYHRRPEATDETLGADGWVSVGDMAVRDADGFYYIVDRKKDLIISGGMNIYPREIEIVIDAVEGVVESAVVASPDAEWGERPVAFVVPASGGATTPEAVIAACQAALARYKLPTAVHFLPELPRNAGGKVLKRELRDRMAP